MHNKWSKILIIFFNFIKQAIIDLEILDLQKDFLPTYSIKEYLQN